ncbi:MAG: class I SAM-dependent methyltransferase [Gammaproteobacteria bacterium]|nr:class I SAM-dependent methyltransferase [Gammaproteobacteria bacterium]
MSIEATGPNADQIAFWNGDAGKSWAKNQALMDSMIEPLGNIAISESVISAADQVLDIGCGCGATSFALAKLGANVTGIDVSEPMLGIARSRADTTDHHVDFVLGDALTHAFERDYSVLFSRFGVMFFADPVAAFRNLLGAMNESGRLCFICWRPAIENAWISVPMGAAIAHMPPMPQTDPRAPGEFAFSDKDYVAEILDAAGYKEIEIDPVDQALTVGGASDIDQAIEFYEHIGPLARVFSELDEPTRMKALDAVREAVQPYLSDDGLTLGSACWLVKARL